MACVFRRCRGDGIRAPLPLMGKSITLGESILSFHLPRTSRSGSRSTTQEIQSLSRTLGLAGNGQTFRGALPEERWADLGERIKPGQTSSSSRSDVTDKGSLGLLSLGAAGLALWRQRRKRT